MPVHPDQAGGHPPPVMAPGRLADGHERCQPTFPTDSMALPAQVALGVSALHASSATEIGAADSGQQDTSNDEVRLLPCTPRWNSRRLDLAY